MEAIVMIVQGKTQPGKRAELRAAFERILGPRARDNAKQPLVIFCEDGKDPDRFALIESYVNMAAMQENGQAPWFAEYMGKAMPLLSGEPEVAMLTPRWAKGLTV